MCVDQYVLFRIYLPSPAVVVVAQAVVAPINTIKKIHLNTVKVIG